MPQQPRSPAVGDDVTALMQGGAAPAVGDDVTALMQGGGQQPARSYSGDALTAGRAALGKWADYLSPDTQQAVGNLVIGGLKGMGHTAVTLGGLVQKVPGATSVIGAVTGLTPEQIQAAQKEALTATAPTTPAQKVGYAGEQMGEFFLPGAAEAGALGKLPGAAQLANAPNWVRQAATGGLTGAGVATAQGANPIAAGAVGAAIPVAGRIATATGVLPTAEDLADQADKQLMQALGPTKERYKAMAQRLLPQILSRSGAQQVPGAGGLWGGRAAMLEKAAASAEDAGQAIDSAIQQFGQRQTGVQPVIDALEDAKDEFRQITPRQVTTPAQQVPSSVLGPNGQPVMRTIPASTKTVMQTVEYEPRAINQLSKLQDILQQMGPDTTADQLVAVRRAWDTVVAQAGGFAHRAPGGIGVPLQDTSEAWAKSQGTKAIRQLLDQKVPELTSLNRAYSFWAGLDEVLTQTGQRTAPQGPGLAQQMATTAGTVVGAATGNVKSAFAMGQIARLATKVMNSPTWLTASAQSKEYLARAIMSNQPSMIMDALSRIGAGTASQATQQPSDVYLTLGGKGPGQ